MELFPAKLRSFWNDWQIRILVLVSLCLQTVLTIFGSRRKYTAGIWIRILIWLAYLSADLVAPVVLGNLTTGGADSEDKSSDQLHAFWVPFLLWQLGGPDTITAYSLEDNELWLRHLLGLVVQIGVTFYAFLRFWSNTALTFLTIPYFITGNIKYGERTLALYRASAKENFDKPFKNMKGDMPEELPEGQPHHLIVEVYFLFKRFALLYAGKIIYYGEDLDSYILLQKKKAEEAFNLVAIELGFMYDLLFTKAIIVYSRLGILIRCLILLSSVSALVIFSIIVDIHSYPLVDILITYLLVVGTIVLDLYALILHFFSDWAKLYYSSKYKNANQRNTFDVLDSLSHSLLSNHKRWSGTMGQFNLISFCMKDHILPAAFAGVGELLAINDMLENYWHLTCEDVSVDLQKLIFQELMQKLERPAFGPVSTTITNRRLICQRGDHVLKKYDIDPDRRGPWFTDSEPFDISFLAWHIATDLCYYDDLDKHCQGNAENLHPRCKISKCLSDYMMYLLVFCPSLLPPGFSDSRYKPTCDDIMHFFEQQNIDTSKLEKVSEARQVLLKVKNSTFSYWGDEARVEPSVLSPGCWLGERLQYLEYGSQWSNEKKWSMVSEVWVEMLAYTACHGEWNGHCQHLRKGGELLTHVRLLMAYLGLSSQYGLTTTNRSNRPPNRVENYMG